METTAPGIKAILGKHPVNGLGKDMADEVIHGPTAIVTDVV